MPAPELGRQHDGTAAANDLVPLVLGLMRLLDDVAAAAATTSPGAAADQDEQLLAALLGVLSVRQTLRRWLDTAAREARRTDQRAPAPRPHQGAWLR